MALVPSTKDSFDPDEWNAYFKSRGIDISKIPVETAPEGRGFLDPTYNGWQDLNETIRSIASNGTLGLIDPPTHRSSMYRTRKGDEMTGMSSPDSDFDPTPFLAGLAGDKEATGGLAAQVTGGAGQKGTGYGTMALLGAGGLLAAIFGGKKALGYLAKNKALEAAGVRAAEKMGLKIGEKGFAEAAAKATERLAARGKGLAKGLGRGAEVAAGKGILAKVAKHPFLSAGALALPFAGSIYETGKDVYGDYQEATGQKSWREKKEDRADNRTLKTMLLQQALDDRKLERMEKYQREQYDRETATSLLYKYLGAQDARDQAENQMTLQALDRLNAVKAGEVPPLVSILQGQF